MKKNKIQVKGTDLKGRTQYIYHDKWKEKTNNDKFKRINKLIKDLPYIKRKIDVQLP